MTDGRGLLTGNDDTSVKILEFLEHDRVIEDPKLPGRTGVFTTGIVSTREGRKIALFFSGRKHAGENLAAVLAKRASELPRPIQMCDALSRNLPRELEVILGNCLVHYPDSAVGTSSKPQRTFQRNAATSWKLWARFTTTMRSLAKRQ